MNARRQVLLFLVFVLLSGLMLFPLMLRPAAIAFTPGARYNDILISHLPNALLLKQSLLQHGQIPLWNPLILSGAPFAADPLSGLFYPLNWLAALLAPSMIGFNLLLLLHLAWAGFGVWKLLRASGIGVGGALAGGLAFAGTPRLIAHLAAGHFGLVCAVSWTPWLLLAVRQVFQPASGRTMVKAGAIVGGYLALILLIDPRWVIPAGLLGAGYGLSLIGAGRRPARGVVLALLSGLIFFLLLSAVLLIPLYEFQSLSTRRGLLPEEQSYLALPAERLLTIIVPLFDGQVEWVAAIGISVLLLALIGVLRAGRRARFWMLGALIALLLGLGDQTPLYAWTARLVPGMGLLRVPARMLLIFDLCAALLAGIGLEQLLRRSPRRGRLQLAGFAVLSACLLLGIGFALLGAGEGAWVTIGASLAAGVCLLLSLRSRQPGGVLSLGWVLLILLELSWINSRLVELRPLPEELGRGNQAAVYLQEHLHPGERVFSPSYSLPQQTAALLGLELADGVNPLQLRSYWQALSEAAGFSSSAYSVTLPPFPSGSPGDDWGVRLDPAGLARFSVGWVASAYPLEGLELAAVLSETYLYRLTEVRPRAWLEDNAGDWEPLTLESSTPNRITLTAQGPGRVVFAENSYPGWRARVNGQAVAVHSVDGRLRGVALGTGEQRVELSFHPFSLYLGGGLSLLGLLALAGLAGRR